MPLRTVLCVVQVYDGTVPWQLGSLRRLAQLRILHYCLTGSLPPNLITDWRPFKPSGPRIPGGSFLVVKPAIAQGRFVSPTGQSCGVTGGVPQQWFNAKSSIVGLDLSNNRLSGTLPTSLTTWSSLTYLYLQGNLLEGQVRQSGIQEQPLVVDNKTAPLSDMVSRPASCLHCFCHLWGPLL